jgi:hypothetical protein
MSRSVARLGPVAVHAEVLLVGLGIGATLGPSAGLGAGLAILLHEVGHAAAAALAGRRGPLRLHLASGEAYLDDDTSGPGVPLVLLAGAGLGGPLGWALGGALLGSGAASARALGESLRVFVLVWSAYQLAPVPVTDGGALLRRAASRWVGPLSAWRGTWALAAGGMAVAVLYVPFTLVLWLAGLALVLGRSEAGHVWALEAYARVEAGALDRAVVLARRAPRYLSARDRARVAEVGLYAALEREDEAAVEALLERLDPCAPRAVEATTWLLRRGRDLGAVVAERIHDAVDRERAPHLEREPYAELSFRHAIHEATRLRPESALGLLERAVAHGYDDAFRIEAEGGFDALRAHPRHARLLAGLRGGGGGG